MNRTGRAGSRENRYRARRINRAPDLDDGPGLQEIHEVRDVHEIDEIHEIHDAARPDPRRASAPFMGSHPLHLVSLSFGTGRLVATYYTARAFGGGRGSRAIIVWDQILATWMVMPAGHATPRRASVSS
ncbi:MAG: hypothetical protein VB124_02425 [Burkholderia sp.]